MFGCKSRFVLLWQPFLQLAQYINWQDTDTIHSFVLVALEGSTPLTP